MNLETKLILALMQIDNLTKIIQDNEYEQFFASHLIPVKYELERQLTNTKQSSKIKE
jgi:hypothetical protein